MPTTDQPNGEPTARLEARPERRLIRPTGSRRHVLFTVRVQTPQARAEADRPSLALALVLDRSGSMSGDKIKTAKQAALAVLDRLESRDRAALVVFDSQIDVIQPLAPATDVVKAHARAELARIEARSNTALYEGWLTGCNALAPAVDGGNGTRLARCFLLTDGLANVGLTDAEQIAAQAGQVRARTGISTSTFGIGADYDENLLGPLAVAGGGQFHHLPGAAQLASTFVGELGGMLAVAAGRVRLEIEADPGVAVEPISSFWFEYADTQASRWSVALGDLASGEEKRVVLRFGLPPQDGRDGQALRARLCWTLDGQEHLGEWQPLRFNYASQSACDDEPRDPQVMRWVGRAHADRAQREAAERSRHGDLAGAQKVLKRVAERIGRYGADDPELAAAVRELRRVDAQVSAAPASPMLAKEIYYQTQRRSRGQPDYRGPNQA